MAILANQAVKEEKKRAGLKNKRKKEKIKTSESYDFVVAVAHPIRLFDITVMTIATILAGQAIARPV